MKAITYLNIVGVMALAILCVGQWQVNRRVNLETIRLDNTRQEQARKIAEDGRTLQGNMADLDDFRARLEKSDTALRDVLGKLSAAESERQQLAARCDQYKSTIDQWSSTVAQRDAALLKANAQIEKLGKDRNDAVGRFNDLASKFNAMVKDLNEARAKLAAGH